MAPSVPPSTPCTGEPDDAAAWLQHLTSAHTEGSSQHVEQLDLLASCARMSWLAATGDNEAARSLLEALRVRWHADVDHAINAQLAQLPAVPAGPARLHVLPGIRE